MPHDVIIGLSRDGIGGSVMVGLDLANAVRGEDWQPIIACNTDNPPLGLARARGLTAISLTETSGLSYASDASDGNLLKRVAKRLFLLRAARKFLKTNRPALIHVHDESSALAWGLAARPYRIPMIWHVHQQRPQRTLDWLLLRLSRYVIFVSDSNRVRFLNKKIPTAQTIYNGVDLNRFYPSRDRYPGATAVVGFVSNLVKRKRPDWVVKAVGSLVRDGTDVNLVIAGNDFTNGQATEELRLLADEEGLSGRYRNLGFQSDVAGLLRGIDVLALPSERDREAFPRIVVEALATGIPVVATDVAGIPEAVRDGVNGRLTDPEDFQAFRDALHDVCTNEDRRAMLSANARKSAEDLFSADAMGARLADIYATLVQPA